MKTIKMIDLVNKIANNEIKKGTKFEIDGCRYIYNNGYIAKDDSNKTMETFYISQRLLNDEVEIIEEEQDIEKIEFSQAQKQFLLSLGIYGEFDVTIDTINKLIDEVNKLKNK